MSKRGEGFHFIATPGILEHTFTNIHIGIQVGRIDSLMARILEFIYQKLDTYS